MSALPTGLKFIEHANQIIEPSEVSQSLPIYGFSWAHVLPKWTLKYVLLFLNSYFYILILLKLIQQSKS